MHGLDLDEHDMPEQHASVLRQSLGLSDTGVIPEKMVAKYWEMKRVFDRSGTTIAASNIAMLCFIGGAGKPTEKELKPKTIVDLWRAKKVDREAEVFVKFRDKKTSGTFKGVNGHGKVMVQVSDDPESEERLFEAEDVELALA